MRNNYYSDSKAPDGLFASGWRIVKKGGRIKAAGFWYHHPKLLEIVGELVFVMMNDYWCQDMIVQRGRIGCLAWFCDVKIEK